jgi:hypothetical protein
MTEGERREMIRKLIRDQKLVIPVGDQSKVIATADPMKGKASVRFNTKFAGPRTKKNLESRAFQELQEEIEEEAAKDTK